MLCLSVYTSVCMNPVSTFRNASGQTNTMKAKQWNKKKRKNPKRIWSVRMPKQPNEIKLWKKSPAEWQKMNMDYLYKKKNKCDVWRPELWWKNKTKNQEILKCGACCSLSSPVSLSPSLSLSSYLVKALIPTAASSPIAESTVIYREK